MKKTIVPTPMLALGMLVFSECGSPGTDAGESTAGPGDGASAEEGQKAGTETQIKSVSRPEFICVHNCKQCGCYQERRRWLKTYPDPVAGEVTVACTWEGCPKGQEGSKRPYLPKTTFEGRQRRDTDPETVLATIATQLV